MDTRDYLCEPCRTAWDAAVHAGEDNVMICDDCVARTTEEEEWRKANWREFVSYSDWTKVAGFCAKCLPFGDRTADRALCDRCMPIVSRFLGRRNAPCRTADPQCDCKACYQARPLLTVDGFRERYRLLSLAAEPARVMRWIDRPARELPSRMAPAALLAAIRAHVAILAGITPDAVTEADMVAAEERLADEKREAERRIAAQRAERRREAEERWRAHLDAYPLLAAQERRDIAARRFEDEIARAVPYLAGVLPIEAATSEDERASLRATVAMRVKEGSDYVAAMAAAVAIAEGRERTVLLGGPTGAGKSTLAALMLLRIAIEWQRSADRGVVPGQRPTWIPSDPGECADSAIRQSLNTPPEVDGDAVFARLSGSVRWTTSREIFALASTPRPFPRPGEQAVDPLADIKAARILVIDELGGEREQKNIAAVEEIIQDRYDSGHLATIVTTGRTDNDPAHPCCEDDREDVYRFLSPLVERYDQAIVRRVADPATATTLAIGFPRPKGAPRGPKARPAVASAPAAAPVIRSLSRRAPGSSRPIRREDDMEMAADV